MSKLDPGYLNESELRAEGFAALGNGVAIARNCTVIGTANVTIGNNVRIDGYCTIVASEAPIVIGSNVHIGAYCLLSGGEGIEMHDFSGLSQGVKIYTRSDDYGGEHLTNPTVPAKYTGGARGKVTLGRHVIVGSGSVILPGATLADGCSVGALSLVNYDLEAWGVYSGCPAKKRKDRSRGLLRLEREYLAELRSSG